MSIRSMLFTGLSALVCFLLGAPPVYAAETSSNPYAPSTSSLIGSQCTVAGKSQLDNDKQNLISCVCKTAGCDTNNSSNLVWAAMSNNNFACTGTKVLTGFANGVPQCATPSGAPCAAQRVGYRPCVSSGSNYFSVPAAASGTSLTGRFSLCNSVEYDTAYVDISAICLNGTWYCASSSYSRKSYYSGCPLVNYTRVSAISACPSY